MSRVLWAILMLLPAAASSAGQVYRTVNPDGSVSYSDTPPAGTAPGGPAMRDGIRAAPTGPAPAAEVPTVTAGTPASKHATAAARAVQPVASPPPGGGNQQLEGAVIGVLGIEDIVLRAEKLCVETLPTSFARYGDTVRRWKSRNAATVELARRRLASDFSAETRAQITTGVPFRNNATLSQVKSAPVASRIKWCDQTFTTMDSGTMDVAGNARLTGPLANH